MENTLKDYQIGTATPEFQFIMDALQQGVGSGEIQITQTGFEDFVRNLERSLEYEDVSIYLEQNYAEAEYNRGYDKGYEEGYEEGYDEAKWDC